MRTDIAVIGGGAAGMAAAIFAKRATPGASVTILEKNNRLGKKLLATGNGRCNYTNIDISDSHYYGRNTGFVSYALNSFSYQDAVDFFSDLGIVPRIEEQGKVFPYSGNASSVLDALRFELERLAIYVNQMTITELSEVRGGFRVGDGEHELTCRALIVATGGKASPSLGSNGSGYTLLGSLGHSITPLAPSLVQLRTDSTEVHGLQGIKLYSCKVSAFTASGELLRSEAGELLFTSYGFSGPPVFQLSSSFAVGQAVSLAIDCCPDMGLVKLEQLLLQRADKLKHFTVENFFSGLVPKRVGNVIARRCGVEKLSLPVSSLTHKQLRAFASVLKELSFKIVGSNGWENAQVTAGGISTDEFFADTMESRLCSGLYAAGELLDIFGDCGGYNLHWAWASGRLAGLSAAGSLKRRL